MEDFTNNIAKIINWVIAKLPTFDFSGISSQVSAAFDNKYIAWLNWFVPVQTIYYVFDGFLVALSAYYVYKIYLSLSKLA